MVKGLIDVLNSIEDFKRSKRAINRELVKVLEDIYSSMRGDVVYLSYRRIINQLQRRRALDKSIRQVVRNLLMGALTEVKARRVNDARGVYEVGRGELLMIINELKEMAND